MSGFNMGQLGSLFGGGSKNPKEYFKQGGGAQNPNVMSMNDLFQLSGQGMWGQQPMDQQEQGGIAPQTMGAIAGRNPGSQSKFRGGGGNFDTGHQPTSIGQLLQMINSAGSMGGQGGGGQQLMQPQMTRPQGGLNNYMQSLMMGGR